MASAVRPIRILVAQNVGRARTGGVSRIMGFIHDRVEQAGHFVDLLSAEDLPARYRGRLARFSFPVLVYQRVREAAHAGRPYDVVNVHEPSSAMVASLKRTAGDPLVALTSHGVEQRAWELALEEAALGREGPSFKTRLVYPATSLWQSALGFRGADHVFCLNEEDRAYLAQRFGIARENTTRMFPAAQPIYAAAAGARDYAGATRLLFAATWRKNKGIEDLVPAFTALAARFADLRLVVLGAGTPDAVVKSAFPAAVQGRVDCVQTRTEAETAAAFAHADLFVLPSLFEGTPLTLMEAMMSGLPIVTTATCGMRDVIEDGRNGLLVPTRSPDAIVDAVARLIDERALRTRLGETARAEAARKYTWDEVAKPIVAAYERLVAGRRGGAATRTTGVAAGMAG